MSAPDLEKKTATLTEAIGRAISTFSLLESHLCMLFASCLGIRAGLAARLLAPIRSFRASLDVIDVAACHKLEPLGCLDHWTSLRAYLRDLSQDRNYLAHTSLMNHVALGAPVPVEPNAAEPMVGPSVTAFLSGTVKRDPVNGREADEIARDIEHATSLVAQLHAAMAAGALNDFRLPIVRRRPPRHQRRVHP